MSTNQPQSPLLSLPREIRDQIYGYLFTLPVEDAHGNELHGRILLDVSGHIPRSPLGLPNTNAIPFSMLAPLCKACKQLYWEATPFYISECILALDDTAATKFLMDWIDGFGAEGWKAIRHLEFTDFARAEDGIDHELLAKCKELRSLSVVMQHTSSVMEFDVGRSVAVRGSSLIPIFPEGTSVTNPDRLHDEVISLGEQLNMRGRQLDWFSWIIAAVIGVWDLGKVLKLDNLEQFAFRIRGERAKGTRMRRADCMILVNTMLSALLSAWMRKRWESKGRKAVAVDSGYETFWGEEEAWPVL